MQFQPQSAEDIALKSKPITGNYPGKIIRAEDCQSKKDGTEMIKLDVLVYVGGKSFEKTTYLHPKMEVLVYGFCKNTGLLDEYQQGELSAELCENKDVMVRLGIKKGNDGYADSSEIKEFLPLETPETKREAQPAKVPAQAPKPPHDPALDPAPDDIPF